MIARVHRHALVAVASCLVLVALGVAAAPAPRAGAHGKRRPTISAPHTGATAFSISCSRWSSSQGQNPSANDTAFQAVTAVSASDVWAVGDYEDQATLVTKSLAEHWNGSAWSVVPSPNPAAWTNWLDGATAISANDVWAVGWTQASSGGLYSTLTEHWNGSVWKAIPSPNGPDTSSNNSLADVSAASSSDVWAVGNDGDAIPLVEHWNGTAWSVVSVPAPADFVNRLTSVIALSATNVWVAGYDESHGTGVTDPLFDHFDGTTWTQVAASNPGWSDSEIQSLAAVSSSDIWAVGYGVVQGSSAYQSLTMHWDGTSWSHVPSLDISGSPTFYLHAAAAGPNNVWAVGYFGVPAPQYRAALIVHWTGRSWQADGTPSQGSYSALYGVSAISGYDAWSVGLQTAGAGSSGPTQVSIQHYNPRLMIACRL